MVLVFALAAAVCVQAFVLSDRISENSAARDQAVLCAESAAETWKSCSGNEETLAASGFQKSRDGWTCRYDENWDPETDSKEAAYQLTLIPQPSGQTGVEYAQISVTAGSDGQTLYALTAACQEAAS